MVTESISVRISQQQLEGISFLSGLEQKKKSDTLREVLELGIQSKKLEVALQKFSGKEVTAAKAARLAGLPLTSFLDVLSERKILFHYTPEDLEEEFKGLL